VRGEAHTGAVGLALRVRCGSAAWRFLKVSGRKPETSFDPRKKDMPKMRVLIAASGARRAATAKALGVLRALPEVEVGAAHDREHLASSITKGRWHALIIDSHFSGSSADELLAAFSDSLTRVAILVLDSDVQVATRCRDRHGASLLNLETLDQVAPAVASAIAVRSVPRSGFRMWSAIRTSVFLTARTTRPIAMDACRSVGFCRASLPMPR